MTVFLQNCDDVTLEQAMGSKFWIYYVKEININFHKVSEVWDSQ